MLPGFAFDELSPWTVQSWGIALPKANLFIVGAPKCGTTAWWYYLSRHPEIFMAEPKEPHYFNTDFESFRWVKSKEQYDQLFSTAGDAAVRGEASVMYLYSSESAKNIFDYNADARILIFLRDHAEFLRSYHQQLLINLDEDQSDIKVALQLESIRSRGEKVPRHCRDSRFLEYSKVASFGPQVQRYIEIFGSERVKILWMEDWAGSVSAAWKEVLEFLGLHSEGGILFDRINVARKPKSLFLSEAYKRPPQWLKRISRVSKHLGLNTQRLKQIVRNFNESEFQQTGMEREQVLKILGATIQHDMDRLSALGCLPLTRGRQTWE
ncbi:hypothetical protein F3N42_01495 [Marinihelvus fidelis]|uniref:Sulfotransferase domain-containing protein n=1 Tax=Marinihelvus fidelis TaxID=2613842 RepID=A0A5N0TDB0_9GAMM|nr:sulfotransferase domain-containing protein [Marinihelvus fidelis]KAA9133063.1 hypothetical protein F3N42_01495 [Marinihelvus fidelis]